MADALSISVVQFVSCTRRTGRRGNGALTVDISRARAQRNEVTLRDSTRGRSNKIPRRCSTAWQAAGDQRVWKLIISPEFGERVDLMRLTRDVMASAEKALQTKLEWVAVAHYNTEHPHVHVALRGKRHDGTPLLLPREFVRNGLRERPKTPVRRSWGIGRSWTRSPRGGGK